MNEVQKAVIALGSLLGVVLVAKESGGSAIEWRPPESAGPYVGAVRIAERNHGVPSGLLLSLLMEESAFRDEIIFGGPNEAGALGIAQIIPKWHPQVNAAEPFEAIDYAAEFLAQNFNRFGDWDKALAAYNWGPTNVAKKGFAAIPRSTRKYIENINARVA